MDNYSVPSDEEMGAKSSQGVGNAAMQQGMGKLFQALKQKKPQPLEASEAIPGNNVPDMGSIA